MLRKGKIAQKRKTGWEGLRAREVMTSPVLAIGTDHSIREAAAFLMEHGIHGAPVVGKGGRVVGVFSMTDVTRYERERSPEMVRDTDYYHAVDQDDHRKEVRVNRDFQLEGLEGPKVGEVMTPSVIAVRESVKVTRVVDVLLKYRVHRVMVMNARGALLGIISETDILKACQWSGDRPSKSGKDDLDHKVQPSFAERMHPVRGR